MGGGQELSLVSAHLWSILHALAVCVAGLRSLYRERSSRAVYKRFFEDSARQNIDKGLSFNLEIPSLNDSEEKGYSKKETDFQQRGLQSAQAVWNFGKTDCLKRIGANNDTRV